MLMQIKPERWLASATEQSATHERRTLHAALAPAGKEWQSMNNSSDGFEVHQVPAGHAALAALTACSPGHWHCLALRDGAAGYEASDALSEVFIDAFVAAGEPVDMAVFRHRDRDNGFSVHWFSPAAHSVATQWHAAECDQPPSADGLSLLLGDDDAWRVFFPVSAAGSQSGGRQCEVR
jgi:hypothetical protein